jgi:hypothetical protein
MTKNISKPHLDFRATDRRFCLLIGNYMDFLKQFQTSTSSKWGVSIVLAKDFRKMCACINFRKFSGELNEIFVFFIGGTKQWGYASVDKLTHLWEISRSTNELTLQLFLTDHSCDHFYKIPPRWNFPVQAWVHNVNTFNNSPPTLLFFWTG